MKKLVSTFLISESFESDLLYIKLVNESPRVDEWVIIESDTTFRGEYKGFCVHEVLCETRFASFLDRINVISNTESILDNNLPKVEKSFFTAEEKSRSLCMPYLVEKYKDDDWIIVADVDESLDFTDSRR